MHFDVIFDIAHRQFNWAPMIFAAVAVGVGILGFIASSRQTSVGSALQGPSLLVVVGILVGIFWWGVHHNQYQRLTEASRTGNYRVLIGQVERFQQGGSNSPDVFEVNNHRFEIWPLSVSESFNRRLLDGGPILSGRLVRIEYTDHGEIIWLGVATATL